jgi:LuxR family maltose regulon positive regulatory protein
MREYFMETVLRRSSPAVQSFLLKTSILKHLTGTLCDAVTGQRGGEEMLAQLWQEGLFIVRLEEQGWYRYHELFSEMLRSQLQARFPDEVPQLHKRAAQWYRAEHAPADAIHHLLDIEAWEEAASLMEEMALRELEQYGEDSRLLRWLQELPANVVQKHKTLLFVYLRLAQVALPRQKIEGFISQIETNLFGKPGSQQTPDERKVLLEIGRIRRAWEEGNASLLPAGDATENDARWELLNGLHLLRQTSDAYTDTREHQVAELMRKAQMQGNLFVLLMAGGVLARRVFLSGQLRRSEKIARQILEQALAQRGKLSEPASITLATLSQICLERNELDLAEGYLAQAREVDPNPTSSNMLVQIAVQRIQMQMTLGNFAEALANSQSIRELHLHRPSGVWSDYDLLIYESFIYIHMRDISAAERILNEVVDRGDPGLMQLARAELLLLKQQPESAEEQLSSLISKYPNGILVEPLMCARVLLAKALFDQHKIYQALQVMKEAIRLAAPEQFYRPFLDGSAICPPLFSLALKSENLTSEAKAFIKELVRFSRHAEGDVQVTKAELNALSASASISPREQEVLRLMSAGYSNREMASKLSISESTIKTHLANIYAKLNVNGRVQAITYAKELKLL